MKIKFRAWDKTKKTMLRVELWDFNKGIDLRDKDGKGYYTEDFENLEITQFTGFLDKLGKEIYEGDIITEGQERIDNFGTINFVIIWHKKFGQWGFSQPNNSHKDLRGIQPFYYNGSFFDPSRFKVIGNVYGNSELLI